MSGSLFAGWRPEAGDRGPLEHTVAALLAAAPAGATTPRARRPDQWHVTLCLVGHDVAAATTARAREALAGVADRMPPLAIHLDALAYWRKPGAIVALPRPDPRLQALCDACAASLQAAGVVPADVTTQPHVTLAYLARGTPPPAWVHGVGCDPSPMQVRSIGLMFNPGGRYDTLAAWPLRGGPAPA